MSAKKVVSAAKKAELETAAKDRRSRLAVVLITPQEMYDLEEEINERGKAGVVAAYFRAALAEGIKPVYPARSMTEAELKTRILGLEAQLKELNAHSEE